jgi:hypothetical protein
MSAARAIAPYDVAVIGGGNAAARPGEFNPAVKDG